MNKIAIKPHKNRGQEIIKIFENKSFKNPSKYDGNYSENITKDYAFIGGGDGAEDCIILTDIAYLEGIGYKIYTLEGYEAEHANAHENVVYNSTIQEIKEKVFRQCEAMYEAGHLEAEAMNRGSQKEMIKANTMFKVAYDNIIYLLHDYYDLIYKNSFKDKEKK